MTRQKKILRIQELLRQVLEEDAALAAGELRPSFPAAAMPSSTDLLVPWLPPADTAGAADVDALWDAYLELPAEGDVPAPEAPIVVTPEALEAPDTGGDPELVLGRRDAEEVVEALYDFLHAVEHGRLDAAMAFVHEDFHSLEDDRELDRHGLRQRLEHLVDRHRAGDLNLVPADVPAPVLHPQGVLIPLRLAIDFAPASGGPPTTRMEERMAVWERWPAGEPGGRYLLTALAPLPSRDEAAEP